MRISETSKGMEFQHAQTNDNHWNVGHITDEVPARLEFRKTELEKNIGAEIRRIFLTIMDQEEGFRLEP